MSNAYEIPAKNPQELLKLIARTVTGRDLLEDFMPLLAKRKVRIEDYPASLRKKLREFIPAGHAIGACLIEDEILIDIEAPRGIVAAFLVHEIAHVLALRRQSTSCREETEVEATQKQVKFTCELRERDPDYEQFLKINSLRVAQLQALLEFEAA